MSLTNTVRLRKSILGLGALIIILLIAPYLGVHIFSSSPQREDVNPATASQPFNAISPENELNDSHRKSSLAEIREQLSPQKKEAPKPTQKPLSEIEQLLGEK